MVYNVIDFMAIFPFLSGLIVELFSKTVHKNMDGP